MRPSIEDPTAGLTALAILEDPTAPQVIRDPTDPRCGELAPGSGYHAGDVPRIVDPTNPAYGEAAASR